MSKHYKHFGIALLLLLLSALLILWIRPKIKVTPAVHLEYDDLVRRYAAEYRLDPSLVYSVIRVESNFKPDAKSHQNAIGLMQITEDTLKWAMLREGKNANYTANDLYDPATNIRYGCYILSLFLTEFEDQNAALAAYNAGRSNVLKWLKDSRYSNDGFHLVTTPYKETTEYIKKVTKYQEKYKTALGE